MNIVNEESKLITSVVLPVIVNGYKWECNQSGEWDLNIIHKALNLPDNKKPSQWRSSIKERLERDANLHIVHGDGGGTWAKEPAAIAYAMWVSDDFYMDVINAFIHLRNNNVIKARNLAKRNQEIEPISSAEFSKLDSFGWSLTDAMKKAQVANPKLAMKVLKLGKIHNPFYIIHPPKDLSGYFCVPNSKGKASGYWRSPEGDGRFNRDGVKVLRMGFKWLVDNRTELARHVALMQTIQRRRR